MSQQIGYLDGERLSEAESKALAIYEELKALLARDDLPPCLLFGAREALAAFYPAVNNLGLVYEYLQEYGI